MSTTPTSLDVKMVNMMEGVIEPQPPYPNPMAFPSLPSDGETVDAFA